MTAVQETDISIFRNALFHFKAIKKNEEIFTKSRNVLTSGRIREIHKIDVLLGGVCISSYY